MKHLKYIVCILAIAFSYSLNAQTELSLSEAIRMGLENNYDLQITKKNEEVASVNNHWGNTGILPSLNFSLSGRENFNDNKNENYLSESFSPELSLNWTFFNGFSAKISKEKFNILETQSKGNTTILIESTIQDIILSYNNCLLQKEILEVYINLVGLSEDRYKRSEKSKEIGVSTTYENLQAKTSWLEDQSNYLQQKVNYENAIRTLNYNLAVKADEVWSFTTPLNIISPEYQLENLNSKLNSNNQTLKNQYLYQSLLAKETALAKSNYYPKISMNTGLKNTESSNYYSGQTSDMNQNFSDAYIGVSLSFNIFNGGATKRSVQIAKISEASSLIKTEQMQHSLNNQLLQLYSNYMVQRTILELADEKEQLAQLNLELSDAKFKNGSINSFNYRDVQVSYLNAAISKFQAIYKLSQASIDLLRITGGIISAYE